jgi:AAA15 family ATPase/GTPase
MLLRFTVGNFKSFKEKATLSMEATSDDWREEDNVARVEAPALRLVKSAAIYGANASGKSNLIEALVRFRAFVLGSSKDSQKGDRVPVIPFRLSTETEAAPTFFEIVFLKDGTRYRYGFETTAEAVVSEWLFEQGRSIRETMLFTRESEGIRLGNAFKEGKGLEEKTRPNALFLSVVAQFNGSAASEVMDWVGAFRATSGLDAARYENLTKRLLGDPIYGPLIRDIIGGFDLGIQGLIQRDFEANVALRGIANRIPPSIREMVEKDPHGWSSVVSLNQHFNSNDEPDGKVEFDSATEWSAGTQQLFRLAGPFLECLHKGSLLIVDELNARLHPLLSKKLVDLFNSSANTKGAQLIFATHDSGLLDQKTMRRDQIWFVEKNAQGASELFSLAEIKGVRKDANFEKEYLLGQFGGVPHLGDLQAAVARGEE